VHIWATVYATLLGFAIGAAAGMVGGIWLGLSPFLSRLLDPYIWAFNALPKVALAPLFLLWFGLGISSKVALAAVLVVFLVFVNTFSGVREVDRDLVDSLRLMRATPSQVLTKVILPSATSWIFVGLRTAVPYALIGAIIGELIASNRGLGYLVQRAGSEFDTAGVFAALVVIAVLAIMFNAVVNAGQARLEGWKVVSR
jgi:NitT/TauT family transport system permease protein